MKGIVGQLALTVQQTGTRSKPVAPSRTTTPSFKTWTAAHTRRGAAVSYAKPR